MEAKCTIILTSQCNIKLNLAICQIKQLNQEECSLAKLETPEFTF